MPRDQIEVIARAVLIEGGQVLLCRNVAAGYYFLPGGHVEFGEAAAAALARELREEAALEVAVGALVLVTEGAFAARGRVHHEINLVFRVERQRHVAKFVPRSLEPEISFELVDMAAVVDLDVRPLAVRAWLAAGAGLGQPPAPWISEIPPIPG